MLRDLYARFCQWLAKSRKVMFFREFLNAPKEVGSVYPSSAKLSKHIARLIDVRPDDVVVEVGAGTGCITRHILNQLHSPKQLIAVERSSKFAKILREHFPDINTIEGNAAELSQLLAAVSDKKPRYIISSLPLRSLPKDLVAAIIEQYALILPSDGKVIQYTYDITDKNDPFYKKWQIDHTEIIWFNLPPAKVNVFVK